MRNVYLTETIPVQGLWIHTLSTVVCTINRIIKMKGIVIMLITCDVINFVRVGKSLLILLWDSNPQCSN